MSTLAEYMEQEAPVNPTHLLLVGPSKIGKTDFVADMVLDGFTVIYIDADNGLVTLLKRIKHDAAAMSRVHYVRTGEIFDFLVNFFGPRKVLRWNTTQDKLYTSAGSVDTDKILEVKVPEIPYGVIIAVDSWTSVSLALLMDAAKRNGVSFEEFNEGGMAAYGDANRRANLLCSYIQGSKHHVVVQAHVEHFERLEKPKGVVNPKQKDMIIKENIMIPSSVSKPHGFTMSKYFNEVGWMRVKATGDIVLDFKQQPDRVGGGSALDAKNPKDEYRFSKLFGKPLTIQSGDWIRTVTAAEVKASNPVPQTPAASDGTKATPNVPSALAGRGKLLG